LTLQNDLGFLASLARRLATREGSAAVVERLLEVERELEDVRLVKERPLKQRAGCPGPLALASGFRVSVSRR
jgi:hypothetical protein